MKSTDVPQALVYTRPLPSIHSKQQQGGTAGGDLLGDLRPSGNFGKWPLGERGAHEEDPFFRRANGEDPCRQRARAADRNPSPRPRHLHLQSEDLDLGALLRDTVESVRHVYDAKSQLLALEVPSGVFTVFGDRTRLTQLFSNLLHNASKYTGVSGRIQVQLRREADNAVVSVRDDGAGISPEMLDRVFELFVQARASHGRTGEGLGIGLSLARRLATMHGGSIEARSEGEGRGSEFVVRLPISGQQVGGG